MSLLENQRWIETAKQIFDESIAIGDFEYARTIIEDAREHGYYREANYMTDELTEAEKNYV